MPPRLVCEGVDFSSDVLLYTVFLKEQGEPAGFLLIKQKSPDYSCISSPVQKEKSDAQLRQKIKHIEEYGPHHSRRQRRVSSGPLVENVMTWQSFQWGKVVSENFITVWRKVLIWSICPLQKTQDDVYGSLYCTVPQRRPVTTWFF